MEQIFHDEKKSCVGDQKLKTEQNDLQQSTVFLRKNTVLLPHDLAFQLIKRKKNYKAKFSTNLILKKNQQR